MKWRIILPAWLLLCTLTAFVSCAGDKPKFTVNVKTISDGIELSCDSNRKVERNSDSERREIFILKYEDENTGLFTCVKQTQDDLKIYEPQEQIYVKFRTCDNCVELDLASIIGIAAGDVVATIVIGVAVYLFVSQNRTRPATSNKKSSDRQHLVPNEVSGSSRSANDHYQPLKHKGGQKETYDVLANRR